MVCRCHAGVGGQDTSVEVGRHSAGEDISMEAGGLSVACVSTVSMWGCVDMASWGRWEQCMGAAYPISCQ